MADARPRLERALVAYFGINDGLDAASEPRTTQAVVDVDLQRALLKLQAPERVAGVLVHAHGLTYSEAAGVLDMPVTTVTNHLSRGRKRLRRILEQ